MLTYITKKYKNKITGTIEWKLYRCIFFLKIPVKRTEFVDLEFMGLVEYLVPITF